MSSEQLDVAASAPARIGVSRLVLGILIVLIPITGLAVWLLLPATPEASAVLLVEGAITPADLASSAAPPTNEFLNRQAAAVVASVLDEGLLREVLNDLLVRETKWYRQEPNKQRLLDALKRRLKVRPTPDTGIITISFRTEDSGDAARIVNTIAQHYLDRAARLCREAYANRLHALTEQESALKKQIQQIREQKMTFITSQLGVPGIASGVDPQTDVIRYLAVEGARIEIEVSRLRIALKRLTGDQAIPLLTTRVPATRPVAVASTTQAADQDNAIEAEYLDTLQLMIAVQERLQQFRAEQRDADHKHAQYASLSEEQARIEKRLDRLSEDLYALQLVLRGSDKAGVRLISMAVPTPMLDP